MVDLTEAVKEIVAIKEENDKLTHMKDRYIKHAKELDNIRLALTELTDKLADLAKRIDPLRQMSHRKKYQSNKEVAGELYQLLQAGTQVTVKLIQTAYPNLDAYYLLAALKKLPGVKTTKDGTSVRLFYQASARR